jgi:hypothetical protein
MIRRISALSLIALFSACSNPTATGPQGPVGPQGPTGEKGDTGLTGPKGEKGDPGVSDVPGPKGEKGDKGDTGPQGIQGVKGDIGPMGSQGPAGKDGINAPMFYDAQNNVVGKALGCVAPVDFYDGGSLRFQLPGYCMILDPSLYVFKVTTSNGAFSTTTVVDRYRSFCYESVDCSGPALVCDTGRNDPVAFTGINYPQEPFVFRDDDPNKVCDNSINGCTPAVLGVADRLYVWDAPTLKTIQTQSNYRTNVGGGTYTCGAFGSSECGTYKYCQSLNVPRMLKAQGFHDTGMNLPATKGLLTLQ